MNGIRFIQTMEIMDIHEQEILAAGGASGLRDRAALESAAGAPMASLDGVFLMDLFTMAATYAHSLAFNHPFVDGNKRTAVATALTFLYLNGYEINELHDEELADTMLDLIDHKLDKTGLARYFETHATALT